MGFFGAGGDCEITFAGGDCEICLRKWAWSVRASASLGLGEMMSEKG